MSNPNAFKKRRLTYEQVTSSNVGDGVTSSSTTLLPPLESTAVFEVGGGPNDSLGLSNTIQISSSLSSGARLFQYNGFFWDNSDFNFTYNNNSIGLVLGHWNNSLNIGYFYIIPIFLPHLKCAAGTPSESSNQNPSPDTASKQLNFYLQQVCYYLNLLFVPTYIGDQGKFTSLDTEARFFSPLVMAQDFCGRIPTFHTVAPYDGSPFVNAKPSPTDAQPLLLFTVSSNNQIQCSYNPAYSPVPTVVGATAFGFMSLEPFFQDSTYLYSWNTDRDQVVNYFKGSSDSTVVNATIQGDAAGLIGKGVDLLGYYSTKIYNPSDGAFVRFSDGYTQAEREDFFYNYTRFPQTNYSTSVPYEIHTLQEFLAVADQFRLKTCTFVDETSPVAGTIQFPFTAQLIASRFLTVRSDALTRYQRRFMISNNYSLSCPADIGIIYPAIIAAPPNTFQDATAASQSQSLTGGAPVGSSRALINAIAGASAYNSPILTMNPLFSIQNIDLQLLTEYDENYNNFHAFQFFPSPVGSIPITENPSLNTFQYFQNAAYFTPPIQNATTFITGYMSITPPPPPYNQFPINPCPDLNAPSAISILNNINQIIAPIYYFLPSSCRTQNTPIGVNPELYVNDAGAISSKTFNSTNLPGTTIQHFARVLGN